MSTLDPHIFLHGGLARERELLRADFASALHEVIADDLTHRIGLAFLGQEHGGAAWEAGNCLLTLRRVSPVLAEARLVMYTGEAPDRAAQEQWCALLCFWADRAWLVAPDRVPERRILGNSPWNTYFHEAARRLPPELRKQLAHLTAAEAAQAFFVALRDLVTLAGEEAQAAAPAEEPRSPGRPGRPRQGTCEKVHRLAYAQRAVELKLESPELTWKEIYGQLGMPFGEGDSGRKKLENARADLHRLQAHDPDGLLEQVRHYREKRGI